jgi:hypothetical protein
MKGPETMTVTLSECQKERIGRIIWANVDGVAKNVMPLLSALNADVATGVKIVAREEWEWCQGRLRSLLDLIADLEAKSADCAQEQFVERLRALFSAEVVASTRS